MRERLQQLIDTNDFEFLKTMSDEDIRKFAFAILHVFSERMDKWIPVSERLPELKQRILVSYETMDDGKKVDVTTYDKYGFLIGEAHAWMPLPKPYKPKESEE